MARQERGGEKELKGFFKSNGHWHLRTDPLTKGKLSTGCKISDWKGALRFREERRKLAEQARLEPTKSPDTLGEWLDKLLKLKESQSGLSDSTKSYYRDKIKALKKHIGKVPVCDLTPTTYDDYILARRAAGVTDYTIQKELQVAGQAIKRAKRAGVCSVDLAELEPEDLDGGVTPGQRALSVEEFCRLYQALPTRRWQALQILCAGLGCRRSEAMRQRPEFFEVVVQRVFNEQTGEWEDVEAMICFIDGRKTDGSARAIPVLRAFRPLIESVLDVLPIGELHSFDRVFKLACDRAGIERCNRNDLRRTNATWLVERGLDLQTVASMLGHQTVAMAKRHYNRAKSIALAPVAERKLAQAEPLRFAGLLPAGESTSRRPDRYHLPAAPLSPAPAALGMAPAATVQKTSRSSGDDENSGRARQDSNLRPSDSKSGVHTERSRDLSEITQEVVYVCVHERARMCMSTVQKTSRSDRDSRSAVDLPLVPVVDAAGRVLGWEPVTRGEVEDDLAPRRRGGREDGDPGSHLGQVGRFARRLRGAAGNRLEVTP